MSDQPEDTLDGLQRFQVLDCRINRINRSLALNLIRQRLTDKCGGYICLSNVHTVVTAKSDRLLRDITNNSFLSLPDGKPLSLYARLHGYSEVRQVAGPDFMGYCLEHIGQARHYFYGSTQDTLNQLLTIVAKRYPGAVVAGAYSPPFRELSDAEADAIREKIAGANADIVWVGLGAPKQEKWMAQNWEFLRPSILMGVGAAFDFHAGKVSRCPGWMQKMSLEWLYRLLQEPRRLWKRYLVTNTVFIGSIIIGALRRKNRNSC